MIFKGLDEKNSYAEMAMIEIITRSPIKSRLSDHASGTYTLHKKMTSRT